MLIDDIYLQVFELKVQAALELFNLSANGLIFSAVSKRISQVNVVYPCGKSTHMALPSVGNPFCTNFLICLYYHKTETEAAAA